MGSIVKGKRHGHGSFKWKNGARYTGEFENDCRKGKGMYYNEKGVRIEGDWDKNLIMNANYTYQDGTKFFGTKIPGNHIQMGII